ncbi:MULTISPECIES: hypothetical protein [Chryseobacterium]|uniref:Uncharacterized protein n=1 Tax=Chryseobacterium piscium TaxID=333702 RepID=A0A3D9BSF8_9FLAO|nr:MULTISPECIES: hypothetical protein [Chryseobacterium]REC40904.1 hypothetical protein DRF69_16750 [Chryseobacterium sp. 5_R23647]REC56271.1 hypothetical protein DRF62_04185 [Chryseobacterium piscium]
MKNISFTGDCPQCELYEEYYKMWDNGKHWECPSCALQINIDDDYASILRHRGNNHFKFNYKEFSGQLPFQEVDELSYPNGTYIKTKSQLIEYLLKNVLQKPYHSVDNLIDSYVSSILQTGSKELYFEQSAHFNIDFEDEKIRNILKERDQAKNFAEQYHNERLYYFLLNNILPKYGVNDISFLPEMGMSKLQEYLCKKHLPQRKREQLNADRSFSKQALRDFAKDLIDIVYFDKPIFLTGDMELGKKIKAEMYN